MLYLIIRHARRLHNKHPPGPAAGSTPNPHLGAKQPELLSLLRLRLRLRLLLRLLLLPRTLLPCRVGRGPRRRQLPQGQRPQGGAAAHGASR